MTKTIRMTALLILTITARITVSALSEDACKTPAPRTTTPANGESPLVCDRLALSSALRKRHFEVLGPALIARRTGVRELSDGYEFQFPSDTKTLAMLTEWIAQERLCCPFFDIDLHIAPKAGPVRMRLTGRPGTKDFMRAAAAAWVSK
jgi:hypothetical protein